MTTPQELAQLSLAATNLLAAKYYDLASFAMLLYDTLLTIPREFDKIWKRKWTGLTLLWFLNRWVFILAVVPTIVAFHDPRFGGSVSVSMTIEISASKSAQLDPVFSCERFFRYAGYIATFQRVVIGSVFILRTYCIYSRSLRVAGFVGVFLVAEVALKLYATLTWGAAVTLPPGFVACVLATSPENATKFAVFWISELCTDTIVLVLTIYRSYVVSKLSRGFSHSHLIHVIVKDGVMYFFVMFAANLTTVIFDLTASQDLKAINANFGVMINCIMTGRLILNLKAVSTASEMGQARYAGFSGARTAVEATILGNIGNELEGESHISAASSNATMVSQSGCSIPGRGKDKATGFPEEFELSVREPHASYGYQQYQTERV